MRPWLSIIICLLYNYGWAQSKTLAKWKPYCSINQSYIQRKADVFLWNFPKTPYDQWNALPTKDFVSYDKNDNDLPVKTQINYQINLGLYRPVNQTGRFNVGINFTRVLIQNNNINKLRFTDQIDPDRGFVMASRYSTGSFDMFYKNLCIEPSYFIQQDLKKINAAHRFGLGLNLGLVLRSDYHIYADFGSSTAYLSGQDLRLKDKACSIFPTFYYEIKTHSARHGDLWLTLSVSDGLQTMPASRRQNYSDQNNFASSFVNAGLKFNFNPQ